MRARLKALLRLMAVQGSWSYERMTGTGVGYASLPLIDEGIADGALADRSAVVARCSGYFNSHPYLAAVAVGATIRAEKDGASPDAIARLRAALSGPLGALGDQLFWAGMAPLAAALALILVPWFGLWPIAVLVIGYNYVRWQLGVWALTAGLRDGMRVGTTLRQSALPGVAERIQGAALVAVAAAVPLTFRWLSDGMEGRLRMPVLAASMVGVAMAVLPATSSRVNGMRFGLAMILLALLAMGV